MRQYSEICNIAGTVVSVLQGEGDLNLSIRKQGCSVVNQHLAEGWELIRIVEHHSRQHDCTGLLFVLGKPIIDE